MLHPSTELRTINPTIGAGVFASEPIPRGTIVWIRDPLDHVFSPEEFDALEGPIREHALKYSFVDGQGSSILCWDLAKYVNHSCEANLLSTPFEFEIAVRDIAAGEQITDDYGSFNIEAPLECHCGSARCRGVIRADDAERLVPEWDAQVRAAFPAVIEVAQPLWDFVQDPARVEAAACDPARLASVAVNYVGAEAGVHAARTQRPRGSSAPGSRR
ncbi:MAG: SET domain-containing protein-lysine N-methyltransferase [Planctomycetes bacterium]|nr:SET domain-containing protein-lysine N-methyltransferase [Planctomycetota bacterium]